MDITASSGGIETADGRSLYDLNFTVEGSYIGIALFIADLEDDSFLEFTIDNFTMTGESRLTSTFVVKDIPINIENISDASSVKTNTDTTTAEDEDANTDTGNTSTMDVKSTQSIKNTKSR